MCGSLKNKAEKAKFNLDLNNLPEEPVNLKRYYNEWLAAMADDFNTPLAIASLFEMLKDVNSFLASGNKSNADFAGTVLAFIKQLAGDVLGILSSGTKESSDGKLEGKLIETLIKLRSRCQKE